jgi:hypothetical protein
MIESDFGANTIDPKIKSKQVKSSGGKHIDERIRKRAEIDQRAESLEFYRAVSQLIPILSMFLDGKLLCDPFDALHSRLRISSAEQEVTHEKGRDRAVDPVVHPAGTDGPAWTASTAARLSSA